MKRARRREQVLGPGGGAGLGGAGGSGGAGGLAGAGGLGGVAGFIGTVRLRAADEGSPARTGYPWELPVVRALTAPGGLTLHPEITYLVGENGSGKSTLPEALAVAAGLNPEGGSSQFAFQTRASHSPLGEAISLVRGARRPRTDFFMRAESLFTAANYLDEPEAALSTQNQLTWLRRIDELVAQGSQFVIATHSPLLLAHPRARIYELSADEPPAEIAWEDAEPVRLTRRFLAERERFVTALLSD